jgi:murein DD-endopeptidase MepM/ murein hydrolase activator NlpD
MDKHSIEIDEQLYQQAAEKAQRLGLDLVALVEAHLRTWLSPEPEAPLTVREIVYHVRHRDTLAKIARWFYGDPERYVLIAAYNGITDPAMIRVGRELCIPLVTEAPAEHGDSQPSPQPEGRRFRFPLNKTETDYYKFGDIYGPDSRWAGKPHPGVDFHQREGADIYAIGEGRVLVNRYDEDGYGHYLMIQHTLITGQHVYSLYAHLKHDDETFRSPPVGTELRGENIVIGKEGVTGYAGLPHLHFEMKKTPQLGLYSWITPRNLTQFYYEPYSFLQDPANRFAPLAD